MNNYILKTDNTDMWAMCDGTFLIQGVKNKKAAIKAFYDSGVPKGLTVKSVEQIKETKKPKVTTLQTELTQ